jgi:hypothetical protein
MTSSSWTRIHQELGAPAGPLTFDLIVQAAAEIDGERDDLDWKRDLPKKAEAGEWNEFAKDVAAMANARGGLLVYGVRDDRAVTGIDPTAVQTEHLSKWLRANTQPFVSGVDMYTLSSADGAQSVLVVDVPASTMAPHYVLGASSRERQLHAFAVPFRYADHTGWLAEHEIARAYQERFRRHVAAEQALRQVLDDTREMVLSEGDPLVAWLIIVARPQRPAPPLTSSPSRQDARRVLAATLRTADEMKGPWGAPGLMSKALHGAPHVGLRRWLESNFLRPLQRERPHTDRLVLAEQHHDGTSVYAADLSRRAAGLVVSSPGSNLRLVAVECRALQVAVCEAVALAHELRLARGSDSALDLTAVLATEWEKRPIPCHGFGPLLSEGVGAEVPVHARCPLKVLPVGSELPPLADTATLRECAESLASGLLNQFGLENDMS